MLRSGWLVCALATSALAQPAPPAITAEPAPPSSTPPVADPPPPNAPPAYGPSYAAPRRERSDRFFFALGVLVGAGDNWLYGAYTGELAATILPGELPIRARVFGALYGGTMESDWNGDFSRFGAGLEGRWCTSGAGTCLFADLDVGYQKLSLYDDNHDFVRSDTGAFAGPRFGFDFGGALRLRFALELYEQLSRHTTQNGEKSFDRFGTVGLSLTLGYQL